MAAQPGRDMLLKIDNSGTFETVAGLRSNSISFNANTVDITDSDSAGRWRELLSGAGVRSASVKGNGIFRDAASDALVRQTFFDGAIVSWQMVIPEFGTVEGPFQITGFGYGGEHNGEITFDINIASAGALTFTGA